MCNPQSRCGKVVRVYIYIHVQVSASGTHNFRLGGTHLGWIGEISVPITFASGWSSAKSLRTCEPQFGRSEVRGTAYIAHSPVPVPISRTFCLRISATIPSVAAVIRAVPEHCHPAERNRACCRSKGSGSDGCLARQSAKGHSLIACPKCSLDVHCLTLHLIVGAPSG